MTDSRRYRYSERSARSSSSGRNTKRAGVYEQQRPSVYRQQSSRSRHADSRNTDADRSAYDRSRYTRPAADRPSSQYSRDHYVGDSQTRNIRAMRENTPVNPTITLVLVVVAAILLVVVIGRFVGFGATSAQFNSIQSSISEQRATLAEVESSNNDLQAQMDSMQSTINAYNNK